MFELSSYDIKIDLIKELKEYLPTITDLVNKIKSRNTRTKRTKHLKELYDLVETIRGACALVELDSLSKTASELQTVVEDIIADKLEMKGQVADAIDLTLTFFDGYTISEDGNEATNKENFSEVMACLKSVRTISCDDKHGIDPLLELSGTEDILDSEPAMENEPDRQCDPGAKEINGYDPELDLDQQAPLSLPDLDTHADDLDPENGEFAEIDDPLATEIDDGWDGIDLPKEELLEGFYQEAEDHFETLGNAMAQLENLITGPTSLTPDHKELLRNVRRAVHTVKGAAAVIRLADIAAWGHEFENLLDWLFEEAKQIDRRTLKVVADSADMLERLISAPHDVDLNRQEELKSEFAEIIGEDFLEPAPKPDTMPENLAEPPEMMTEPQAPFEETQDDNYSSKEPAFPTSVAKTLRVEMGKIESLVNLAGELIIALSGFDDNMNNFNTIIGELDRSRLRLKNTARELESGYELKAIRNLNHYQHQVQKNQNPVGGEFTDFDLLELDRYSEFNLLIRSLNETAVDVNTISSQLSHVHRGFKTHFNRLRILLGDLQEKVMRVRMTPMTSIVNRLRSTVRETAAKLQKNARLAISGEEIELDKRVWETLADPLMHLLRNAIDHGIEPPDLREERHKPDLATIQLTAAYQGNQVFLRVIDDGAGLNFDAIRSKALELDPEVINKSDADLAHYIFHQGFSTRKDISEISGRGIGLDVVQENIAALKGSVKIERTERGLGTTILIRIPLTLAVMRSLIFEVNGRLYATALYDIQEILRIHPRDLESYEGKAVQIDGRILPFYKLSETLPKTSLPSFKAAGAERMLVLMIDTGSWQAAIAIDRMHTQKEIVVKSLGSHLHHVQGIAGATIMGDGQVIPILNLEELLRDGPGRFSQTHQKRFETAKKPLDILIVDDSVSIRMVISRLLQRQGWGVQTAKDGVEAMEMLHRYEPDLIVLDIEMPRMNGYEFMRMFRAQEKNVDTPVIMLTSRSAQKHRQKADDLDVNAFLVKPYEDSFFLELIRKLTGLASG